MFRLSHLAIFAQAVYKGHDGTDPMQLCNDIVGCIVSCEVDVCRF